jgi:beta-galactosidase
LTITSRRIPRPTQYHRRMNAAQRATAAGVPMRAGLRIHAVVALLACIGAAQGVAQGATQGAGAARMTGFDDGWRFQRGDIGGAAQPDYPDGLWQRVRLPHDWAIDGPFSQAHGPHMGGLPTFGVAWYRKSFRSAPQWRGQRVSLAFDGVMSHSTVYLNGQALGGRPNGYIGFSVDLTGALRHDGRPNVLAVRLAPEYASSRWYPGAGIYRHVWLQVTAPVHLVRWGTFVGTPQVDAARASVAAQVEVANESAHDAVLELRLRLLDPAGHEAGGTRVPLQVAAGAVGTASATLPVERPELWGPDRPSLYRLVVDVHRGRELLDRETTPFGIRRIELTHDRGVLVNGVALRLHGVCLHHDLGALGTAVNRRAIERRLEILKGAGVNAIRTSHNPPAPELLDAADRLGFLVLDEAFDSWRIAKVPNDYSRDFDAWSATDLADQVRRDRNHPSVFMWSIGNEIPEQDDENGWREARRLSGIVHASDATRPTTSAFDRPDRAMAHHLVDEVDVPGFNYSPHRYAQIAADHPGWIFYGSETSSCVSSRGVYHLPIVKYEKHPSHQLSSYDIIAPNWAYCPDFDFEAEARTPAVLGGFVWTGFDYIGEPTPYFGGEGDDANDWPAHSSYFGMVDLAGFPKDRYFLYQSVWTSAPMVHVLPHWNWPGHEGQPIPVMAYSNAQEVELFLNGRSLGRQRVGEKAIDLPAGRKVAPDGVMHTRYRLLWQVPYEPGTLRAVAYRDGREVAHDEVRTAGPAARIALSVDRTRIAADGDDLAFVTARVEDKDGVLVPDAADAIRFAVRGAGDVAAVDNGDAASLEPFHADHRHAFNGLAQLVVRSRAGKGGDIRVQASADGLAGGELALRAAR